MLNDRSQIFNVGYNLDYIMSLLALQIEKSRNKIFRLFFELIIIINVITLNVYTLINLKHKLLWQIQLGQLTLHTPKFSLK
jgi:fumarate reductase subunit C